MSIIKTWPTLFKLSTTKKVQQWTVEVERSSAWDITREFFVNQIYGQVKGKLQTKSYCVKIGKNIGRSNATKAIDQAIKEAQARFDEKLKQGYVKTVKAAREGKTDTIIKGGINPMLAHPYDKYSHTVKFPCFVQPKLDGERCVAHYKKGKVTLWTRSRKQITSCPHIIRSLELLVSESDWARHEFYLDGELYNHLMGGQFEKLMSAVRKQKPSEESLDVQFHIYDFHSTDVVEELPFKRRNEILNELPDTWCGNLYFVPTTLIHKKKEIQEAHDHYVKDGYEGIMLRNMEGDYENKRSKNLLKFKSFQDAEFKIEGFVAGKDNTVIAVLKNNKGKMFQATMSGDKKRNQEYLKNEDRYIGKLLTVKFQDLTGKNGVPRFPVGLRVREE